MILPPIPTPEMVVPIAVIIATKNGRTCGIHQFGCGNDLVLARPTYSCGLLLHLWKTTPDEIAAIFIHEDGSDGCRVGFTPQEQAVGAHGCLLDGVVVRVFEVFTPEHPNSHCRSLYHRNRGYALTEIVNGEDGLA